MAIEEFATEELSIFTIKKKEVKDSYTMRKFQRDRLRSQVLLTQLLDEKDLVLFYIDEEGIEQHTVATRNSHRQPLEEEPITMEDYKKGPVKEIQHISFLQIPGYTPMLLHVDCITKFIVASHDIYEILNRQTPPEDLHGSNIKQEQI